MSLQKINSKALYKLILSVLFIIILALAVVCRQWIVDVFYYVTYKPSADISSIEDRLDMTSLGEFVFRVNHPEVDGTDSFNDKCQRVEKSERILGCYTANRIYIYDVVEPRLDGIREVTAAHEMLHSAYARLSTFDKKRVNELLNTEYEKIKDDEEIKAVMNYYDRNEPGQFSNELHSIIGTQVGDISPELETYYERYFTNRQKITVLYDGYVGVFEDLRIKADQLMNRINELKDTIEGATITYNTDVASLNNDIQQFNVRAENGEFASMWAFYSERNQLLSRQSSLQNIRDEINSNINERNGLIDEYNSIASESKKLQDSLDSTLSSQPTL